uniref:Uncharacterized protein n=1 Tax=Auxenochlorella protothecoides TaxID=3075 RepID=A0A1D1ZXW9_AUXPR
MQRYRSVMAYMCSPPYQGAFEYPPTFPSPPCPQHQHDPSLASADIFAVPHRWHPPFIQHGCPAASGRSPREAPGQRAALLAGGHAECAEQLPVCGPRPRRGPAAFRLVAAVLSVRSGFLGRAVWSHRGPRRGCAHCLLQPVWGSHDPCPRLPLAAPGGLPAHGAPRLLPGAPVRPVGGPGAGAGPAAPRHALSCHGGDAGVLERRAALGPPVQRPRSNAASDAGRWRGGGPPAAHLHGVAWRGPAGGPLAALPPGPGPGDTPGPATHPAHAQHEHRAPVQGGAGPGGGGRSGRSGRGGAACGDKGSRRWSKERRARAATCTPLAHGLYRPMRGTIPGDTSVLQRQSRG